MTLRETIARRVSVEWVREFATFGASTFLYQGGRFTFYLAAASALAPSGFATWALVLSVLVYAPALLLGITNGMSRELPILAGSGDEAGAQRTEDAAWVATAFAAVAAVVLSVLVTLVVSTDAATLLLAGLLSAGSIIYFTALSALRSRLRFDAASGQQATFGILAVLVAVALGLSGGASLDVVAASYGLCLAVSVVVGLVMVRPSLRPPTGKSELLRLARIGFPIMAAGLLFSIYVTLDRWIAIALLGSTDAAPYALASLISAAALIIPSVVSQQFYPRMGIARGDGASAEGLRMMARDQGFLAVLLVGPIVIALDLFAWLGIPAILPEYGDAVLPVIILSLGLLALAIFTGYGNYLNVVGGQWRYLGAQVVGLVTALSLMAIGGTWLGLIGVAAGMSLSHLVYGLVLRGTAVRTGIHAGPLVGPPIQPV